MGFLDCLSIPKNKGFRESEGVLEGVSCVPLPGCAKRHMSQDGACLYMAGECAPGPLRRPKDDVECPKQLKHCRSH